MDGAIAQRQESEAAEAGQGARRRGACPTLAAPMPTGDGLLARLRPIDPALSIALFRSVLAASGAHGSGLVEITARGSLQVRGLTQESAGPFARAVETQGFPLAEGPAVEVSPLCGLDDLALSSGRDLAAQLRGLLDDEEARAPGFSARLAPKLSIVIDEGGRVDLSGLIADLRLRAVARDRWVLFLGPHAVGPFGSGDLLAAVRTCLQALAAGGPSCRGRDLDLKALGFTPWPDADPPPARRKGQAMIGPVDLGPHGAALGLGFAFGQARAEALDLLLEAAEALSARDLRLAPGHGLIVTGLDLHAVEQLRIRAEALGFIVRADHPALSIAACAGQPACASATIETKMLAERAAQTLAPLFDRTLSLHVSGCSKGCALPKKATLTLVGGSVQGRLGLIVNGRASDAFSFTLDADDLDKALTRLSGLVAGASAAGESAGACLMRLTPETIAVALQQG
ncbi:hypothetical protein BJF93_02460 [Xaviernesmea oryzae]|uniref:Precorrin-3B synthase n=1 Tax=Xaviernesmea oryzae TaxID=464029 RepID=A0A1Q9AZM6_9HYPH|nr:hypothetical protein [Xaviernesmea oryzae]OLP61143.1 hypothetical protein BJF93_02460 [Xaviernesmea oryzae]